MTLARHCFAPQFDDHDVAVVTVVMACMYHMGTHTFRATTGIFVQYSVPVRIAASFVVTHSIDRGILDR